MNRLESKGLVVIWGEDGTDALDKTWQEIHDAMEAGMPVTMVHADSSYEDVSVIFGCAVESGYYQVYAHGWTGTYFDTDVFQADAADGTLERLGD